MHRSLLRGAFTENPNGRTYQMELIGKQRKKSVTPLLVTLR